MLNKGESWDEFPATGALAETIVRGLDENKITAEVAAAIILANAAPDLLAALEGLLECGPGYGCEVAAGECCHHVTAARAAIAKARGQE